MVEDRTVVHLSRQVAAAPQPGEAVIGYRARAFAGTCRRGGQDPAAGAGRGRLWTIRATAMATVFDPGVL